MRTAIISDVHSNLQALERVLDDIDNRAVDHVYCLGDIVGYCANPHECIALVREKCEFVVAGNHDWVAVGKAGIEKFNITARTAIEWTADMLNLEEKQYLAGLPLKIELDNICLVHSTPREPENWGYLNWAPSLPAQFASFEGQICFVGHCHRAFVWNDFGERIAVENEMSFQFEDHTRYFVGAGSVGQPRDGDPRAVYLILDSDKRELAFFRLEYDIEKAANEIEKAGLPPKLALRLYRGF